VVLYCHGWPSSRLEAGMVPALPARLLAVDRPGYGNSDPDHAGTLRSRAADLRALADHLGLDRFAVIGVSGGGPLAAALAHDHPDRVTALALISAVPPPDAAIGRRLHLLLRLGRHPILATLILHFGRMVLMSRRAGRVVFDRPMPVRDREVLTPSRRAGLLAALREGLRHGVAGARADARLYATPWGFDPAGIRVPVSVWHGTRDQLIPAACATSLATAPQARLTLMEGHGHYSPSFAEAPRIAEELLHRANEHNAQQTTGAGAIAR
jgi:pimeloyl-ACP methyl ester carboxylesterase